MSVANSLLHTVLVTDGRGDLRRLDWLVEAALAGGIAVVQLREPILGAGELFEFGRRWLPRMAASGSLLVVNDRADVALAGGADGVHLGHRSLPPSVLPGGLRLVGSSVHDAGEVAAAAVVEDLDYLHLAPLFVTRCKPGVAPLGVERAGRLVAAARQPVVLLGGIGQDNVELARRVGAAGVAVMSAICDAADPMQATRDLVATAAAGTLGGREGGR